MYIQTVEKFGKAGFTSIFEIITQTAKNKRYTLSFEKFNLSPDVLSGLKDVQIDSPNPLHDAVLPPALEGKHLLIKCDDKTGDDAAILIPAIQKLASNGDLPGTRVLILTPSIDRAKNIDEMIWAIGYHAQIGSVSLSMKGDYDEQVKAMQDGAPIIVANPGRLDEILKKNDIKLDALSMIIIEEAHEMHQYNMVQKVINLFEKLSQEPQVLIFSDDYNNATRELSLKALKNPELIGFEQPSSEPEDAKEEVEKLKAKEAPKKEAPKKQAPKKEAPKKKAIKGKKKDGLESAFINIPPRLKISTLMAYLEESETKRVVLYAASRRTTDRLYKIIRKKSWSVVSVHPELEEDKYAERFEGYKNGDKDFILIGEASAKDINIDEATLVINYDIPNEVEEFDARLAFSKHCKASTYLSLVSKMDKEPFEAHSEQLKLEVTEIPLPENIQDKKSKPKKETQGKPTGPKDGDKKKNQGSGSRGGSSRSKSSNDRNQEGGSRGGRTQGRNQNRNQGRGRGGNGSGRQNQKSRPKKQKEKLELPRSNYDKLSGGRDGDSANKGVVGFFKKLFS